MSDRFLDESSEAQRRAEKINAIRRSVRGEEAMPDTSAQTVSEPVVNKSVPTAEDILRELDAVGSAAPVYGSAEQNAEPEEQYESPAEQKAQPEVQRDEPVEEPAEKTPEESEAPVKAVAAASAAEAAPKKKKSKKKKKKKKKTFKESFLGLFPGKGDSIPERLRKLVFLGSMVAIIVCGYLICDYYYELWASRRKTDNIMEIYQIYNEREPQAEEVEDEGEVRVRYAGMLDSARHLYENNPDVAGVIVIPDTPINNPIMQSSDNNKYLDKKFDLSENRAGELFLDYRNHFDDVGEDGYLKAPSSDNLIIYGHNMADDHMFGSLKYYQRYDNYYKEHPVIYLNSNYERYTYKIFSVFVLDAEDKSDTKFDCWNTLDFGSEEEFYSFVNEAKKRNIRLNDVDVKYGDPIITLSTCSTVLSADKDRGRLIIMARRVRDGEDPYEGTQNGKLNPNIKWPNLYYETNPKEKYDPNAEFVPYGPGEGEK